MSSRNNRLRKSLQSVMSGTKVKKVGVMPFIKFTANPNGTVRAEGPLAHRDLCYKLLEGGKAALDEYYAGIAGASVQLSESVADPPLPVDLSPAEEAVVTSLPGDDVEEQ